MRPDATFFDGLTALGSWQRSHNENCGLYVSGEDAIQAIPRPRTAKVLEGVIHALNERDHAEAAIRIAQNQEIFDPSQFQKANFNPSQPRNKEGEWSKTGSTAFSASDAHTPFDVSASDAFCRIVKQLCIVEATGTLPTADFGATFFKALNACMDRHGCLGRA